MKTVMISLPEKIIAVIDKRAKELEISRSEIIRTYLLEKYQEAFEA